MSSAPPGLEPAGRGLEPGGRGLEPAGRSIFRPEAVRRHARSQEEAVLPRFISPRIFLCLWLLAGLLAAGTAGAWALQVPSYVTLPAVVTSVNGISGPTLVIFIPSTDVASVRPGQRLFVTLDGRQLERSILAVDPVIRSPALLRQEYRLDGGEGLAVTGPSATAVARLEPLTPGADPTGYLGSVEQVEVEAGSVRLLSLLPFLSSGTGG